eukprot:366415-Chlamydomonas_euryale.AAC.15
MIHGRKCLSSGAGVKGGEGRAGEVSEAERRTTRISCAAVWGGAHGCWATRLKVGEGGAHIARTSELTAVRAATGSIPINRHPSRVASSKPGRASASSGELGAATCAAKRQKGRPGCSHAQTSVHGAARASATLWATPRGTPSPSMLLTRCAETYEAP